MICKKSEEEQVKLYPVGSNEMKVLSQICQTTVVYIPAAVACILCSFLQIVLAGDLLFTGCQPKDQEVPLHNHSGDNSLFDENDNNDIDIEFHKGIQTVTLDSEEDDF